MQNINFKQYLFIIMNLGICSICCFCILFPGLISAGELIQNGDFEDTAWWTCPGCDMSKNTDAHSGRYSLRIYNRQGNWSSPRQLVRIIPGHKYRASCFIKILNMPPGIDWTRVDFMCVKRIIGDLDQYEEIGLTLSQQLKFGWTELGGDFVADHDETEVEIFTQFDKRSEFLIDHCSLEEIIDKKWKQEALSVIEQVRKAPLRITIEGIKYPTNNYSAELIQTKSAFTWGTVVNSTFIDDLVHTKYQKFVFDNFEWAITDDAFEWRQTDFVPNWPSYRWFYALEKMVSNGMSVLGKALFVDQKYKSPIWLSHTPSEFRRQMSDHVKEMLSKSKRILHHWIVNNEDLESRYHEDGTNDTDITQSLFREVRALGYNVKLFLNNRALSDSDRIYEYVNQGKRFKSSGIPVYGLGTDGNFGPQDPDYERVKFRLSKLAEAGIPIYVTGLTIVDADDNRKAKKLEDMLTLLYGHPSVQGVFLGALWDGDSFDPSAAMANGNNVELNAAGRTYLNLVRSVWRTNSNFTLSAYNGYSDRAFLGEYILRIRENGSVIHEETFSLDKGGKTIAFSVQGHMSKVEPFGR